MSARTRRLPVMKSTLLAALLAVLFIPKLASSLNILVLNCQHSRSHFEFTNVLTIALLERGHQVHELVKAPTPKHPNRTTFAIDEKVQSSFFDLVELTSRPFWITSYRQAQFTLRNCERALNSQAARDLLALARDPKRSPIDVVVVDYIFGQCLAAFAHEFGNAPIVAITAYGNPVDFDELLGGPTFPSFVPHDFTMYSRHDTMTWTERLHNKIVYMTESFLRVALVESSINDQMRTFFGDQVPSLEEIKRNVAVALVNSHPALQGSRPQLPAVIEIGGIHVPPLKKIPEGKLKQFLDSAKDGFILMSLGSNLRLDSMELRRKQSLMRAFERLTPLRFVVKWEKPWEGEQDGPLPNNVFLSPWLPQSDILGHPNIRLFVTHCGLLSVYEIIYRAVPVVAMPFMVDQFFNAKSLEAINVAKILPYDQLTEHTFYNTVRAVLDDESYAKAARRHSSIVQDQVETPKDRALFWVEFVGRHGNVPYLRSPAQNLSWLARWMIDDILILLVMLFGFKAALRYLIKLCTQIRTGSERLKED